MDIIFLVARALLAGIFILSGIGHFAQAEGMSQYAQAKGVPAAKAGVLFSGVLALVGGLSVLLGVYPDLGALLLVVFLLPVTFFMHAFWKETDPMVKQTENIAFLKNVGLIGGALILFYVVNQTQDVAAGLLSDPLFGKF
jgi:putative oxidoreductase